MEIKGTCRNDDHRLFIKYVLKAFLSPDTVLDSGTIEVLEKESQSKQIIMILSGECIINFLVVHAGNYGV